MKPTQTQFAAYQQIFDHFNRRLFENSLPDCMLSFSRRRSSSHALFTSAQWREGAGSAKAEISLNVKQLREAEPIEVMAVLVRQMVHLWQERYGHPSNNGYYNREWAEKMAEIGLMPSATGLPGGRRTGQGMKHFIEPEGRFSQAFSEMPQAYLWPFSPAVLEGKKRERYTEKVTYRCPGCGAKVWGKGGLGLICECGRVFACETGETKTGIEGKVYRILAERYGQQRKR
jgi:hypothetical protein